MKTLLRLLGLFNLAAALLIYVKIKSMTGLMAFWLLKLASAGAAPFLALAGIGEFIAGVWRRDRMLVVSGACSALLAGHYVRQITASPSLQTAAADLGQKSLPSSKPNGMLKQRWSWQMPSQATPRWERDIHFASVPETDQKLFCDIWQPPEGTPPSGLAFMYVHGGAWYFLDKDTLTRPFFRHLAAQGHVVMDVAYRRAPRNSLHGMICDVKRAIAWLKSHAGDYGINPARVVIGGGSAGAHLAMMAAYAPYHPDFTPSALSEDTSVCGVVAYYGPTDMVEAYEHMRRHINFQSRRDQIEMNMMLWAVGQVTGHPMPFSMHPEKMLSFQSLLVQLMGGLPEEMPENYARYSPITYVNEKSPPTLLIHGAHDCLVPVEMARRMRERLEACRVPTVYVEYPFTDHAFDLALTPWSPAAQASIYEVDRFLAGLL